MSPEHFNRGMNNPKFDYKITTFLDGNGNIHQHLISNNGKKNVGELANFLSLEKLTSNQARKFYDAFVKIYNQQTDENVKKIQLLVLKAQAEYSYKRKTIKERFKSFIENRLDVLVKSSNFIKELEAFKLHFQSLIAYLPK